jgi:hypothetical protein
VATGVLRGRDIVFTLIEKNTGLLAVGEVSGIAPASTVDSIGSDSCLRTATSFRAMTPTAPNCSTSSAVISLFNRSMPWLSV